MPGCKTKWHNCITILHAQNSFKNEQTKKAIGTNKSPTNTFLIFPHGCLDKSNDFCSQDLGVEPSNQDGHWLILYSRYEISTFPAEGGTIIPIPSIYLYYHIMIDVAMSLKMHFLALIRSIVTGKSRFSTSVVPRYSHALPRIVRSLSVLARSSRFERLSWKVMVTSKMETQPSS